MDGEIVPILTILVMFIILNSYPKFESVHGDFLPLWKKASLHLRAQNERRIGLRVRVTRLLRSGSIKSALTYWAVNSLTLNEILGMGRRSTQVGPLLCSNDAVGNVPVQILSKASFLGVAVLWFTYWLSLFLNCAMPVF